MTHVLRAVIGYDSREDNAYRVCWNSLRRHATIPLHIVRLSLDGLVNSGIYQRSYRVENCQMIDDQDSRPFSTQFAFSRFLVPALALYDGWVLFCDCDFLFTADVAQLLPLLDSSKAVMVVKHNHIPSEIVKMDGQSQAAYSRKNWSSFVLWNCSHPANRKLRLEEVNTMPGRWLHGFHWLKDSEIGELPATWNFLSGVNGPIEETPKAIHFTLGTPDMPGYENSPYADLWRQELEMSVSQKEFIHEENASSHRHYGS